jgi:hypothetical protein
MGRSRLSLPAPLRFTSSVDDLTAYMDKEVTPEGAMRIGMEHGSIHGFGSEGEASNYVAPGRADSAGLSYLAMGDWHRQMRINDRCWYSGTPEPDQFKLPPNAVTSHCNGGSALLVEIKGSKVLPVVSSLPTGRYQWHRFEKTLTEDAQIDLLESELRALDSDLSKLVVDLRVTGAVSLSERRAFEERILQSVGAAFRGLRFDEASLVLNPTEQDLDEIDHAGFVRVAADRLKALGEDMSNKDQALLAALALKRLYIEHLRQGTVMKIDRLSLPTFANSWGPSVSKTLATMLMFWWGERVGKINPAGGHQRRHLREAKSAAAREGVPPLRQRHGA